MWWEVARGRGGRNVLGGIHSWIEGCDMNLSRGENSEMRLVGWSVGHLRTRTRFSAMGVRWGINRHSNVTTHEYNMQLACVRPMQFCDRKVVLRFVCATGMANAFMKDVENAMRFACERKIHPERRVIFAAGMIEANVKIRRRTADDESKITMRAK